MARLKGNEPKEEEIKPSAQSKPSGALKPPESDGWANIYSIQKPDPFKRQKNEIGKVLSHPYLQNWVGAIGWVERGSVFYNPQSMSAEFVLLQNWGEICQTADKLFDNKGGMAINGIKFQPFATGMEYGDVLAYVSCAYIMQERMNNKIDAASFLTLSILESHMDPNSESKTGIYVGALQIGPTVPGIGILDMRTVNRRLKNAGVAPFENAGYYYDAGNCSFTDIQLAFQNKSKRWFASKESKEDSPNTFYEETMKNPLSAMMYAAIKFASSDEHFEKEMSVNKFIFFAGTFQSGGSGTEYARKAKALYKWIKED